jgi:5-methylcytosine-specific restriction enzyme A
MTRLPEPRRLAAALTDRFGLALTVETGSSEDGAYVDLRPTDLHANEGFFIRTNLGWRHIRVQLHVGNFAGDLLHHMAKADPEQRARFVALERLLSDSGGRATMSVNGAQFNPRRPETWPAQWTAFELVVERTPLMVDHEDSAKLEEVIIFWGGNLLGMAVSLLPVEEVEPDGSPELKGLPEGALQRIEVNRYERNRINRALCIAIHGNVCLVCHFDFNRCYGEIGRDFIHVHHVVPVSRVGAGYVIDPANDLVPVCPNCHAMLHRRDPPFTVAELREQVQSIR